MSKFIDRTGKTFGRWKVTSRAEDHISPKGQHATAWNCECSCKGENSRKVVLGLSLVSGNSTSCGCVQKERTSETHFIDLTGKIFGRWKVTSRAEDRTQPNGKRYVMWNCECSCKGKNSVKVILGSNLTSGNSTSCGCYWKEKVSEANFIDLTGKIFGRWLVVDKAEDHIEPSGHHTTMWNCECSCKGENSIKAVAGSSLVSGNSTSCGCYRKEANSGANSHFWKDGITPLSQAIRTSAKYKEWRISVFERDNYTCQYSGSRDCKLEVHHIKPFAQILEEHTITTMEDALGCKELWGVSNGITLAKEYHSQTSENPNSFHNLYGTYATQQDFKNWFAEFKI